jgi:hypothetical protein
MLLLLTGLNFEVKTYSVLYWDDVRTKFYESPLTGAKVVRKANV